MCFPASRLFLEAASNEPASVVYVGEGKGGEEGNKGNKEGATLKFAMKLLCVSCHCGKKSGRQHCRGPREPRKAQRARLKEMSFVR